MSSAKPRALVAMSGGVDSSVAAAMLLRRGFEVVGCFMRLGSPGETLDHPLPVEDACRVSPQAGDARRISLAQAAPAKIGHQGCCSITDAADARLVAAELSIPFYVCNFKKDFARVIDYFVDEYDRGRTPNPCVRCNDWLKFGKLHEYARALSCEVVASGHYARIVNDDAGEPRLCRGVDADKDQSYVLFGVRRDQLGHMLLPIGELEKPRVRDLAQAWGLPVFDKPDSQEICFVPDNDYAGLVERLRPGAARGGALVDTQGRTLGEHGGQHRFTVGQRRGLDVAVGRRVYVVGKDPSTNTVIVGDREDLRVSGCVAGEANWLVDPPETWRACIAQYRAHGEHARAEVRRVEDSTEPGPSGRSGRLEVRFAEPREAVAPGQAIVLYDDAGRVLGGGWIERALRAEPSGER